MVEGPPSDPLVIRYPRRTGIWYVLDMFVCFIVWHYFLWFNFVVCTSALLYWFEWLSFNTVAICTVLYWTQLIFWRPQLKNGLSNVYKHVLYSKALDGMLYQTDATLIREAELDPADRYLFCWAPHGILGVIRMGSGGSAWSKLFPGITVRWGSFGGAFYVPGAREFSLFVGCIDAGMKTLMGLRDENISLIPGGIREMNLTDPNSKITYVTTKNRTGFVRLAQAKELKLLPVFCFGEKWMHGRSEVPWPLNALIRSLKMSPLVPRGRWRTMMPRDVSLGWVYGKPITTKDRSIEEIHQEYCDTLHRIFDTYKKQFGYDDDEKLMIVEPGYDPAGSKKEQ